MIRKADPVRTLVTLAVAVAVGAILAMTAAFALVAANAPDAGAKDRISRGETGDSGVVKYGQR
jgi:hypothetical protein